jgi:hypothetical protein
MMGDDEFGAVGVETEVLGENLAPMHKVYMARPGLEPWPSRWEASD